MSEIFPQSNEECLKAFEQAQVHHEVMTEAQENYYTKLKNTKPPQPKPTKPAPPILGAGGVKNLNFPHRQLSIKL